ncbi:MAG: hypothetical protein CUN56_03840 [Phototrophicales bacterium]|nr:MAG: hypothetical protein CUN56_03840 [Phototrophicales bacterium]RMG76957.1 MAG: hypothetical protein D6711_02760 [Chloroflexota bacterium]
MTDWLSQLDKDTLPQIVLEMFTHWCVWEQARPALVTVLQQVQLEDIANQIERATDLRQVVQIVETANQQIKALRTKTGVLGISAAEAATFEFVNLFDTADEKNLDTEAVSFFAARVCGWAGWARSGFTDATQKTQAEEKARQDQEAYLAKLVVDQS